MQIAVMVAARTRRAMGMTIISTLCSFTPSLMGSTYPSLSKKALVEKLPKLFEKREASK